MKISSKTKYCNLTRKFVCPENAVKILQSPDYEGYISAIACTLFKLKWFQVFFPRYLHVDIEEKTL